MLSEIGVVDPAAVPHITDAADERFAKLDCARLTLRACTPDELLPPVGSALSERFRRVPSGELRRSLLHVLKKAVGNAYKWGNRKDPSKRISIDVTATRAGAVVTITDEGAGFDVADLLQRFESGSAYATHGGSGFAILEKSKSAISYADAGRTVLIGFRCVGGAGSDAPGLAQASDERFMLDLLRAHSELCAPGESLVGCRIAIPSKSRRKDLEIRYDLELQSGDADERRIRTLTGTLLHGRDVQAYAELLCELHAASAAGSAGSVRMSRPLLAFCEPPLVLFALEPIGELDDWLKRFPSFEGFAEKLRGVARFLRALHESGVEVDSVPASEEAERTRVMCERVIEVLASASALRAERARALRDAVLERWERIRPFPARPIHGSFSWKSILWTADGLCVHGFDAPRRSHPGLDVGGFLADHLRFFVMRKKGDPREHSRGRDVFLDAYFDTELPAWREDLPLFLCVALLARTERLLGREQKKWEPKIDPLLDACEQTLASEP